MQNIQSGCTDPGQETTISHQPGTQCVFCGHFRDKEQCESGYFQALEPWLENRDVVLKRCLFLDGVCIAQHERNYCELRPPSESVRGKMGSQLSAEVLQQLLEQNNVRLKPHPPAVRMGTFLFLAIGASLLGAVLLAVLWFSSAGRAHRKLQGKRLWADGRGRAQRLSQDDTCSEDGHGRIAIADEVSEGCGSPDSMATQQLDDAQFDVYMREHKRHITPRGYLTKAAPAAVDCIEGESSSSSSSECNGQHRKDSGAGRAPRLTMRQAESSLQIVPRAPRRFGRGSL